MRRTDAESVRRAAATRRIDGADIFVWCCEYFVYLIEMMQMQNFYNSRLAEKQAKAKAVSDFMGQVVVVRE